MRKREIVQKVAEETGLTLVKSEDVVDAIIAQAKEVGPVRTTLSPAEK